MGENDGGKRAAEASSQSPTETKAPTPRRAHNPPLEAQGSSAEAPVKSAAAADGRKPVSVFDAEPEPFQLRPPNETAPISVASAVASALYAKPRPVAFVAPAAASASGKADADADAGVTRAPQDKDEPGAPKPASDAPNATEAPATDDTPGK